MGVEGEAREIVETHNAGIAFESENKKEFLEGVIKLSSDKILYNELIKGCSELADAFQRERLAAKMLTILREVKEDNERKH